MACPACSCKARHALSRTHPPSCLDLDSRRLIPLSFWPERADSDRPVRLGLVPQGRRRRRERRSRHKSHTRQQIQPDKHNRQWGRLDELKRGRRGRHGRKMDAGCQTSRAETRRRRPGRETRREGSRRVRLEILAGGSLRSPSSYVQHLDLYGPGLVGLDHSSSSQADRLPARERDEPKTAPASRHLMGDVLLAFSFGRNFRQEVREDV